MEGGQPSTFSRKVKSALIDFIAQKFVKVKKNKYQFTALGEKKIKPASVPKRDKVDRPVKNVPVEKESPPPTKTQSGRLSQPPVLSYYKYWQNDQLSPINLQTPFIFRLIKIFAIFIFK
jgi:hypothetical protein